MTDPIGLLIDRHYRRLMWQLHIRHAIPMVGIVMFLVWLGWQRHSYYQEIDRIEQGYQAEVSRILERAGKP